MTSTGIARQRSISPLELTGGQEDGTTVPQEEQLESDIVSMEPRLTLSPNGNDGDDEFEEEGAQSSPSLPNQPERRLSSQSGPLHAPTPHSFSLDQENPSTQHNRQDRDAESRLPSDISSLAPPDVPPRSGTTQMLHMDSGLDSDQVTNEVKEHNPDASSKKPVIDPSGTFTLHEKLLVIRHRKQMKILEKESKLRIKIHKDKYKDAKHRKNSTETKKRLIMQEQMEVVQQCLQNESNARIETERTKAQDEQKKPSDKKREIEVDEQIVDRLADGAIGRNYMSQSGGGKRRKLHESGE